MGSSKLIRKKALEFILGLMVANMRAGGVRAYSTVSESIEALIKYQNMASGLTENAQNGSINKQ